MDSNAARAVAEALFAGDAGPPPEARVAWLVDDFDDFLESAGPRSALIIGSALRLATWVAPLMIGKRPPLARLDVVERCRALSKLESTPVGLPVLALKAVLSLIYYEHPDAMREIGVDADCMRSDS